MKKIAFLFPGQGSQAVGMGVDFYNEFEFVKDIFNTASDLTGIDMARLCFSGPMEALTETINLQPAVTAVNLSCYTALAREGVQPHMVAGHSLGEYSALYAAGVTGLEDTIRLVFKRGQLMHREATRHPGAMSAIVGLGFDKVQELVAKVQPEGAISIANHNSEQQLVITGASDPVQKVSGMAKELGAKAIALKVSGAWHSQLIKAAEGDFIAFMDGIPFQPARIAVVHNVTADVATDPSHIKTIMGQQLCNPVRWYDSICRLIGQKVSIFAEIGPGKVLTGLVKKTVPRDYPCQIYNVNDLKTFERFIKEVA